LAGHDSPLPSLIRYLENSHGKTDRDIGVFIDKPGSVFISLFAPVFCLAKTEIRT
jgi:hypothetical protein